MAKKGLDERFARFGTVSFASVTQVNDFIDCLENGKLMGTKSKACGLRCFPPRAHCYRSLANDMEWFEVTGKGKLVSCSTLQYAPTGFSDDLPYTVALLDYGDYRVFDRIDRSVPAGELCVGMEWQAVASRTGNDQLTYVFQKAWRRRAHDI
jgi:uncharacterized protein